VPIQKTPDGRYTFAIETPGEGDGNSAVLDGDVVVWDRFSHEAKHGPYGHDVPPVDHPPVGSGPIVTVPQGPTGLSGKTIKVTDASDGEFVNRMYPYYSSAVIIGQAVYAFAGTKDGHPKFFRVDLENGSVYQLGAMLRFTGEAEGWYWDAEGWIYLCNGSQLLRVNPFTQEEQIVFDIAETHPGCDLWQAHSSLDGRTHSATVRRIVSDGAYPKIGTVVVHHGQQQWYPAIGDLDESAITSDGAFLIIKEGDLNRIITVATGDPRIISDADGAVGHSDCGPSCVVGEDDQLGACVLWDLRTFTKRVLFSTWNMGHVSVRAERCLLSDAMNLSLVALDGSGVTTLAQHGMTGNDYDHQCMANLSPCGRVAAFMSNTDGRMNLYLLVLP
jgi:hypothetical protein